MVFFIVLCWILLDVLSRPEWLLLSEWSLLAGPRLSRREREAGGWKRGTYWLASLATAAAEVFMEKQQQSFIPLLILRIEFRISIHSSLQFDSEVVDIH